MEYSIFVLPLGRMVQAKAGETLLSCLRREGLAPDAPCGGNGTCGKCKVLIDAEEVLACRHVVEGPLTVTLPLQEAPVLSKGEDAPISREITGYGIAFDIGTTTVAAYLLHPNGTELYSLSAVNPQASFGADVVSRIAYAVHGQMEDLTASIRRCAEELAKELCRSAGISPEQVTQISIVGNPAMEQLFLGIPVDNLTKLPFAPLLTKGETVSASTYLPCFAKAKLLIPPEVFGFVGADTLACLLSTGMGKEENIHLLIDIGTNGEMVLGNRDRLVTCSTAAGPALEGANITKGMRAMPGAIDHVWAENDGFGCSVIGGGKATGLCGSGLIDAVCAALNKGLINKRGKILTENGRIDLTEDVYLTQEDIRQVQLAKGAIAAGVSLLMDHLGITEADIDRVYVAGAFGSFMTPESIFRVGLLPVQLKSKYAAIGNAAGSGAKGLLQSPAALKQMQQLRARMEHLQLASLPDFDRCFARHMYFVPSVEYWCSQAQAMGFVATKLDVTTLLAREDVRAMCKADTCRAYGKNWTCPPHCGTLEQCQQKMASYSQGILLQTVGKTEKLIDTKAYRKTERLHLERFYALANAIRLSHPQALCLGSGGCRICNTCAYPGPCRFPEEACPSMEGYGLFVADVCRQNGAKYHYGEKTITYTGCILF